MKRIEEIVAGHNNKVLKLMIVRLYRQSRTVRCWKHSRLQSDNNKFSRRADRNRKMATEGHGRGGKKNHQQQSKG
jgi:hypothetical protein